jgi:hypothetical protein
MKNSLLVLTCLLACTCRTRYVEDRWMVNEPLLDSFLSAGLNDSVIGYCYFADNFRKPDYNHVAFWIRKNDVLRLRLNFRKTYSLRSSTVLAVRVTPSDMQCFMASFRNAAISGRNGSSSRCRFRWKNISKRIDFGNNCGISVDEKPVDSSRCALMELYVSSHFPGLNYKYKF